MSHFRGPFVSELGDPGGIVECVWASGLNLANAHDGGSHPATAAEREALRVAGGGSDHAGATLAQLKAGLRERYGILDAVETWSPIIDGILSGRAFVVRGDYQSLPLHFRRWRPSGVFSHAAYAGPGNDALTAWWHDPLSSEGYGGEPMPLTVLRAFCASNGFDALGLPEFIQEADMPLPITPAAPVLVTFSVGDQLYTLSGAPLVTVSNPGAPRESHYASGIYRVVLISTDGVSQLALVKAADVTLTPVPPLPPDPAVVQAAVDQAVAEVKRTAHVVVEFGG